MKYYRCGFILCVWLHPVEYKQLQVPPVATFSPPGYWYPWSCLHSLTVAHGFRHTEEAAAAAAVIQVRLCYLKWNVKQEAGRQQVKREHKRTACVITPRPAGSRHRLVPLGPLLSLRSHFHSVEAALLTFASWLSAPLILSFPSRCWCLDSLQSCSWLSPPRTCRRRPGSW